MKLKGLYTALATPFDSYGKLDQDGLRENLRYQLNHQVDGIVVLGTTGEAPTLSSFEKKRIIEIAYEEIKGKAKLIVGTGSYSTEQTIAETIQAYEMGADAALIVIPYYNKPTQEGLFRHFKAICEAVPLPICIYNAPGRTSINLHTDTLERLSHFPSIIGVKETSKNIMQVSEMIERIGQKLPDFGILSGDDDITLPLVALGGHGVISVISNLIPGPMQKFVQASLEGDFIKARHWHYQLLPFFNMCFIETNPIPIKAAMQNYGMPSGSCRLPLCDLSPLNKEKMENILNTLPQSWIGEYGQAQSSPC